MKGRKGTKQLCGTPKTPRVAKNATTSGVMRASAGAHGRAKDRAAKKYYSKRANP